MYGSIAFTDSYEKSKKAFYRRHELRTKGRSCGMNKISESLIRYARRYMLVNYGRSYGIKKIKMES